MRHGYLLIVYAMLGLACGSDDRPAEWGYLHEAIIRPSCATVSCHTGENAVAGLRLQDAEEAYSSLASKPCGSTDASPSLYLVPGEPEQSRLIAMLRGDDDTTMPPDRLLPIQDIELLEEWIAGGAPCK